MHAVMQEQVPIDPVIVRKIFLGLGLDLGLRDRKSTQPKRGIALAVFFGFLHAVLFTRSAGNLGLWLVFRLFMRVATKAMGKTFVRANRNGWRALSMERTKPHPFAP